MSYGKQARRYFVSGIVQGVGFRYFAQHVARNLELGGYVRNLFDGRVEVFAMGTPAELAQLRAALQRGPRLSSVREVREEVSDLDPQFEHGFFVESDG